MKKELAEKLKSLKEYFEKRSDVEKILGINTDFVVLNRAPSTLVDSIIREGEPIIIKNKKLYWDFFLLITSIATDFREFINNFWEIKQRSQTS